MPNVRAFVKPTWFVQYDSLEDIERFSRAMHSITTSLDGIHGRGTFTKDIDGSAIYSGETLDDQTITHGQYVTWASDNVTLGITDWSSLYQPWPDSVGSDSISGNQYRELPGANCSH